MVAEPTRLPTQLYYYHFILNFDYIEPNASLLLLRCRDPHAFRAALAWATYILQNVFFELRFFALTWSGHRQGLLYYCLLEQTRGLPRMENQNSFLPTEDGNIEEGEGGMH